MADDGAVSLASLAVEIDTTPVPAGIARLNEMADAGGRAETAAKKLTAADKELAAETRRLTQAAASAGSAHDDATAALVRETKAIQSATNAYADFYDAAQRNFATQYTRQLGSMEKAHVAGAKAAKLQAHEVLNLSRQFADIGVTAAMGMNPLMIAIQQLPQIGDILQTAGARGMSTKAILGELGTMAMNVLGKAGPFAIGTIVIGTLGGAFLSAEKDANRFANALAVTGNFAGATAGELEAMAKRSADAVDVGVGKARGAIATLVSTGDFSARSIEVLSKSALQLSEYTGKSAAEVAADFAKMGDSVADYATKFNDQHHLMTLAQLEHIRALEDRGDIEAAQYAASVAIYEGLGKIGPANLGLLERAWKGVTGAIGDAWEALKDFGKAAGVEQKLALINDQLGGEYAKRDKTTRNNLLTQKAALEATLAQQKAAGEAARVQDAGVAAAERMRTSWAGMGDNVSKARSEIAKYRADIEAIRKANPNSDLIPSAARQRDAEAAIMKRYTPAASGAASKAASAAESAAKAAARHAEQLEREARAMDAAAEGALKVAAAYRIGEAEALRAAATADATSKAITKRGDAEAFVRRQLDLNAAKAAEAAAKTVFGLEQQIAAQERANRAVVSGSVSAADAAERMANEARLAGMIAQADAANGNEKAALTEQVIRLAFAQDKLNRLKKEEQIIAQGADFRRQIEMLELERSLIGKTNRERAVAIARMQKQQDLARSGLDKLPGAAALVDKAGEAAGLSNDVQRKADNYNASLDYTLDLLRQIADHAKDAGAKFTQAFEGMGEGAKRTAGTISGVIGAYSDLQAREEAIRRQREVAQFDQVKGSEAWMHAEVLAARESKKARVGAYGDMAAAGKSFFEQGSAGYKVMQAAEIAFRTVEMAMSIRAMAQQGVETATKMAAVGAEVAATGAGEAAKTAFTTAGTAVRTPLKVAEGAASMFAALGPLGFVAVGGMLAVMAGLGFSGGGRGSAPGAGDMEARQKAQGTGSVLGDSKAKSDSIAKSLEIVAANTNRDLEYSIGMLKALMSIDSGIGALAAAVARSLSAGGALDTSDLNLGKTSTGPGGLTRIFAPISNLLPGLFGTRTTRTLQDQGLQFGSQSLSDILSGGIKGQTYQQVLENTQKKFLGLSYSNKDKVTTTTGALDADLSKQITDLIGSLKRGVLDAAGILGVTGAEATLDAFKVELGKMSFKDMSGAEIKEALNAIFGKLGDDLAATAIPELTVLQKVGEGAFETLARVARQYQVVDVSLKSIGMTFGAVGVSSLKARERLVDLAGGIDEFADQVRSFAETYLTDVERMAPIQRAVAEELARLNLTSVKTKDQFKNIVLGLDLTTEAGAQMYAALMALAPAFAKVIDFQTEGSKAVQDARDAVQVAYDRETEAAERMRDKFLDLAKSMRDLDKDLEALMDRTPAEAANRSADEFASILQKARAGDADAMGQLAGVTQNYAEALKGSARSRLEYDLGLAAARDGVRATEQAANRQVGVAEQQLAAAKAMVAGILTVNDSVLSLAAAVANYRAAQQAQAVTPAPVTPMPTAPPPANDNPTPTPRAPDWDSYVQHYTDVRAEGERLLATADRNSPWFKQHGLDKGVAGFGEWHWNNKGKGEGRTPYAAGGLMDRPITLGESGIGGEAGPEGILPLANVGGKMGVHAVMGREDSRQLAQMLGEMQRMNAALVAIARSNHEMNKNIRRILNEGISVHGAQPGDPVPTKAAA